MGREGEIRKQVLQMQIRVKLLSTMLGTLVNFSSMEECLVEMMSTEEGKIVMEKVGEICFPASTRT